LPEDRLASLHLRENDLGTGTPRSVKDEVDRRSAPTAEQDRLLLDDLGILRPCFLEAVAVDARGRRPRLPRLQHQPALERQPHQVRQLAVCLRIARHDEGGRVARDATAHAAAA
jgi:hypothetical protein